MADSSGEVNCTNGGGPISADADIVGLGVSMGGNYAYQFATADTISRFSLLSSPQQPSLFLRSRLVTLQAVSMKISLMN